MFDDGWSVIKHSEGTESFTTERALHWSLSMVPEPFTSPRHQCPGMVGLHLFRHSRGYIECMMLSMLWLQNSFLRSSCCTKMRALNGETARTGVSSAPRMFHTAQARKCYRVARRARKPTPDGLRDGPSLCQPKSQGCVMRYQRINEGACQRAHSCAVVHGDTNTKLHRCGPDPAKAGEA